MSDITFKMIDFIKKDKFKEGHLILSYFFSIINKKQNKNVKRLLKKKKKE